MITRGSQSFPLDIHLIQSTNSKYIQKINCSPHQHHSNTLHQSVMYIHQKIKTMSHLLPNNVKQDKKVKRLQMIVNLKTNRQTSQTEIFVASNKSTLKQIKASIFSDFGSLVNPKCSQDYKVKRSNTRSYVIYPKFLLLIHLIFIIGYTSALERVLRTDTMTNTKLSHYKCSFINTHTMKVLQCTTDVQRR